MREVEEFKYDHTLYSFATVVCRPGKGLYVDRDPSAERRWMAASPWSATKTERFDRIMKICTSKDGKT